jgi:hypothetical protein
MSELKEGSYKIGFALKKNGENYDVKLNDYNYDEKAIFVEGEPFIATLENSNGNLTPKLNDDAITEAINKLTGKNVNAEAGNATTNTNVTDDQVAIAVTGGTRRIKRRKSRGKKSKNMKCKMSKRRRYK